MFVIGIVGGIASGKSEVAKQFELLGAAVVDADRLGHEVLDDPDVVQRALHRWGREVLDEEGKLIRSEIARIIFAPNAAEELEFWEKCTHPGIKNLAWQRIDQWKHGEVPPTAVVLDAALLFEAGWDTLCDAVVFVDVPLRTRQSRAQLRGWTEAQFQAREAAQMPVDEKREKADFVIDNSGTLQQTYTEVQAIWNTFQIEPT